MASSARAGSCARLKAQLSQRTDKTLGERVFGVMLVDGLSNAEETLVAAVHWAFDDMQLIGGSAGDGLAFKRTVLIYDGRALDQAAILIMIESDIPFRIFKTQNFEPTPIKLVVTSANTRGPRRTGAQRGACRARVRFGHRPHARRSRSVQLRVLSAGGEGRRRLLLPLDPQHERRRQPVVLLCHRRRARVHASRGPRTC